MMRLQYGFMLTVDRLTQLAFRLSWGRLGGRQLSHHILLLTTTGRKTGQTRTHALQFIRDGERYVICASNMGAPQHPAWYLNLTANPHAHIQDGRKSLVVTASEATGDERDRLWQQLTRAEWRYVKYQRGTPRLIPVVILMPDES